MEGLEKGQAVIRRVSGMGKEKARWRELTPSTGSETCWLPKCSGLLTAGWIRRSGSGSSISPGMPTVAPLWRPTANSWSRSPWGPRVPFKTATQEFRTDEKAAGTNAPAAVVTPSLAPGGRGLLLAQGQGL
jgi:hypothetical protein